MKPLIIFDLDGTLVDTPSGIVKAFIAGLDSMGITFTDTQAIRATIGMPLEKAFSQLLAIPVDDVQVSLAVRQYQAAFREIVLPQARALVFPGVVDGLSALKNRGYGLAVATSKVFTSAQALLEAANLWSFFDLVVGADMVTHPKPHPEMGLLVMSRLGNSPENSVMVGDTTHDLLMAKQAGIHAIGVTWGIHDRKTLLTAQPGWIVDSFDDVVNTAHSILLKTPITTANIS